MDTKQQKTQRRLTAPLPGVAVRARQRSASPFTDPLSRLWLVDNDVKTLVNKVNESLSRKVVFNLQELEDLHGVLGNIGQLVKLTISDVERLTDDKPQLEDRVEELENEVAMLKSKVTSLEAKFAKLRAEQATLAENHAMLVIRELLHAVESCIYKHFIDTDYDLSFKHFTLTDAYCDVDDSRRHDLDRFLRDVDFSQTDSDLVRRLLQGWDSFGHLASKCENLNSMVHPSIDSIVSMQSFDELLTKAKIDTRTKYAQRLRYVASKWLNVRAKLGSSN